MATRKAPHPAETAKRVVSKRASALIQSDAQKDAKMDKAAVRRGITS